MEGKSRVVAADGLVLKEGKILLVKRSNGPYEGFWAIPGGHVEWNETCEEAVMREVKEETNLRTKITKLIGVYSDPSRDPRQTITVAYLLEATGGKIKKSEEATEIGWFPLDDLPTLAFDHQQIIQDYRQKYRD